MKVPVSYIVNNSNHYNGQAVDTSRLILELLTSSTEKVEISVSSLSFCCNNDEMLNFAAKMLQDFGSKEEIAKFLSIMGTKMQESCPEAYENLNNCISNADNWGV